MRQIEYPNIYCAEHNRIGPGYMICRHVASDPVRVHHVEVADEKNLGVIACADCDGKSEDRKYVLSNFSTCCADCVKHLGVSLHLN